MTSFSFVLYHLREDSINFCKRLRTEEASRKMIKAIDEGDENDELNDENCRRRGDQRFPN